MQFRQISKCPKFNEQQSSIVSMPTCDFRRRTMMGIENGDNTVQLIKVYAQKNVTQKGYA